ncbi:hypothetical protein [Kordiimonas sp.]|uniref:hypothetical protein n=1 Tax=Kordiimonas sp. TaxID=1970157 RepID=UPI003A95DDD4
MKNIQYSTVLARVGREIMFSSFEFWSFLGGLLSGGIGGALITLKLTKNMRVQGNGRMVDQSKAQAGGDIVAGNKKS